MALSTSGPRRNRAAYATPFRIPSYFEEHRSSSALPEVDPQCNYRQCQEQTEPNIEPMLRCRFRRGLGTELPGNQLSIQVLAYRSKSETCQFLSVGRRSGQADRDQDCGADHEH